MRLRLAFVAFGDRMLLRLQNTHYRGRRDAYALMLFLEALYSVQS